MTLPLPTYEPQYAQFANHQQKDALYHAANKSAAGTGGARVARYRRAVMEPKAEPRKRHTREISGSIGKDCIQKQAPQKNQEQIN